MLKLLISKDWLAVRDEILSRIASDVAQKQGGRILMVPELISHDTERRLCTAAGDTSSRFAEVLSFTRLARRVSEEMGGSAQECLDNGGRLVAMAAAARQLHSQLKAYASVETKPEFLSQLVDAVDEFKRCCISAEDLAFAARQTEGILAQKLEELSLLLGAYDGLCSHGKKDPRDQMTWLLEQLEAGSFGENHVFYIDGFPDYTRQHMAILEHLIRVSPMVTVGLNCDRPNSDALAFEKAGDTAAQILKCAKDAGIPVEIEVLPGRQNLLMSACTSMFQGKLPENVPNLRTLRADSEYNEILATAEQIMALVQSGCRYRDIGVVCANMGDYQDLLELVFHRCGIPLYRSGTEDILRSTVIAMVLSALEAALEGFEQEDVLRYLRCVLSPLDGDCCDRIENYAVMWGIRGNRWREPWQNHPEGLNKDWTEEARESLAKLNEARAFALEPLIHLSNQFKQASNLSQQVAALMAFLEAIHLDQKLSDLAQEMDASGDNRSAQILNQLWEILLSALEQMQDVLGQTVWEPEIFTRLLTLLLSQYNVGTIPPVLDAVSAGTVSAMRCHQVKHLFVLGASEGSLPGYGGSAGLLSDQERVALRKMGVPLTGGAMEGIQAEFAEIYGVFCGATEAVTVSYPGGQPSYIYRRLSQMCEGEMAVNPQYGAALADAKEAGAYLSGFAAESAAEALGVSQWYRDAVEKTHYDMGNVSKENISGLYGKQLHLSATQIDRQAGCRMSYFLQYGLRAKERKEITVDSAEFGTYVHAVLEKTVGEVMRRGGFHQVPLEETLEIASHYSEEYAQEHFSQIDSQRVSYLFRRNRRELEMVVSELWRELKESKFVPKTMELEFGRDGQMEEIEVPSHTMKAVLGGKVDRVDVWQDDGRNYFRIVDYKTGDKQFNYCDVFNGMDLQLLIYLFALQRGGADILGEGAKGVGVQYFPARAELLDQDGRLSDEEAEKARVDSWVRHGLLLNDEDILNAMDPTEQKHYLDVSVKKDGSISGKLATREQMALLEQYVFYLLGRIVDEIASGDIQPNPYLRGKKDACKYCPYGSVCKAKNGPGRRSYKEMTPDWFWGEMEKEVDSHG